MNEDFDDFLAIRQGKRIVFTNGCFDLLHVGHLRYLKEAKILGDLLVVGLNSDESVKRLKGSCRPIHNQEHRREMLLGLKPVDFVFIFQEDTPMELIQRVCPEILVKGGDWKKDQIVGAHWVESYGGQVLSLSFQQGFSSTGLIDKILD